MNNRTDVWSMNKSSLIQPGRLCISNAYSFGIRKRRKVAHRLFCWLCLTPPRNTSKINKCY